MTVTGDRAVDRLRNNGDTGKGNNPSEEWPAGSTLAQGYRHGSGTLIRRRAVNHADRFSEVLPSERPARKFVVAHRLIGPKSD